MDNNYNNTGGNGNNVNLNNNVNNSNNNNDLNSANQNLANNSNQNINSNIQNNYNQISNGISMNNNNIEMKQKKDNKLKEILIVIVFLLAIVFCLNFNKIFKIEKDTNTDNIRYNTKIKATTIYNENNIKIVVDSLDNNNITGKLMGSNLKFTITNNSSNRIIVTIGNLYINDVLVPITFNISSVDANSIKSGTIAIYNEDLKKVNINSEIKNIRIPIKIQNNGTDIETSNEIKTN